MKKQRLLLREALFEVVALEQSRHTNVGREFDQPSHAETVHPLAIETDLGAFRIENLESLAAVGFSISRYLVAREGFASFGASGRIANHRGKISHQEDHRMPIALKIAQLLERDGMSKMQIGRGRIRPVFDAQRPPQLELLGQLRRGDYFNGAMA